MQAYEKLGVFYLGRRYDAAARAALPDLVLYDSSDLTTHALVVGMTGSGKTGLCFDLIEEAALDGIPAILIDPKGDLGNLLLTFPELAAADFAPWVDPAEAQRSGLSVEAFAAQQAERWKTGLARSDQDGERIRRLRDAAEFAIYTPGSSAGLPVSILDSFAAPPPEIRDDPDWLRDRIATTVAGLLTLAGIDADPTKSREAVFLGNVVQHAWQKGRDLDLGALLAEIETPSVPRIGLMTVEAFYPAKERFALATAINAVLAAPGFGAWLEGEPLDIKRLYYTPAGKPRVAIFSIAHLNDAERMFFVTLLLNELLGWMRTQSGTTSLRALLYMDEIFGYFPPVANPPSKQPLLTLLKQGRAFGLGVVLATQNPVDLDYKGLANIGTWFLGRLQTQRDVERVLDGLAGAAAATGAAFDRDAIGRTLGGLESRTFLLHDVHMHEDALLMQARWAMSYLRGPMTRDQIKTLTAARRAATAASGPSAAPAESIAAGVGAAGAAAPGYTAGLDRRPPTLPPSIPQHFLPAPRADAPVVYRPTLLGAASVRFADAKAGVDLTQNVVLLAALTDDAVPVDWATAREIDLDLAALARVPQAAAEFAPLPAAASRPQSYGTWEQDLASTLRTVRTLTLLHAPRANVVQRAGESEADFRLRVQQSLRELRDAAVAKLRARYAPKIAALNDRLARAERAVERESAQATQAKLSSAVTIGTTILGAFLGRRALRSASVGRAGTALRSVGRAAEQSGDVARAEQSVDALRRQLADLDRQFQTEATALTANDAATDPFERLELHAAKANIDVKLVTLAWAPHLRGADGEPAAAL